MAPTYVSYSQAAPSTYSFTTTQGKAATVTIATALNLGTYDLTVECSRNSAFRNAFTMGTVQFVAGNLSLALTALEVDTLKGGFYRIRAVKNNVSSVLVEGTIEYRVADGQDSGVLDGTGKVREQLLPPLTEALETIFLKRKDYVSGVVDPAILDQAVANRLQEHVNSATPHPAYDVDMQDLAVLFENRLT